MIFYGLHVVDIVCLVLYLAVITFVGLRAARLVHTVREFFMPRRFGRAMMIMHAFGTGTHSDQAVGVASKTYENGLSGIWYQWLWLFCTPFYWLMAPFMKRFRAITTGDVFQARYDRSVAALYALIGMAQLTLNIGIMLKGTGAVVEASTGGRVSSHAAIAVITVLFVAYGVAGGLSAAIVTDFLQGIMTIVFSFLLLPFALHAVGGMTGLRASITDPEMFSLVAPGEIGLFYILVISFNALVGIVVQPHTLGICAAGKTEMEGRVGFMAGTLVKRVCTIAWCLTALAALAHFGKAVKPDLVYGRVAREFLPGILPGLLGIFLASLLAAVMSSCDSFMTASSGLFTENIYKQLAPGKGEGHYLFVGRIASVAVVLGGVAFAYWVPGVKEGLKIFWKMAAMVGVAFWLGLFWRRATVAGAWAATLTCIATWWLTTQSFFIHLVARVPNSAAWRFVWEGKKGSEIYLPWQMVSYLVAGTLVGIVVSLLTRPVDHGKLERFYALTRTPIAPGEVVGDPCTLPAGATPQPRRTLFPNTSLEVPIPSLTSVVGFLVGWVCVALLIGAFVFISRG